MSSLLVDVVPKNREKKKKKGTKNRERETSLYFSALHNVVRCIMQQQTRTFDLAYYGEHGVTKENPLLGLGSGDSYLFLGAVSGDGEEEEDLFAALDREVKWSVMTHKGGPVPRLVAIQAPTSRVQCVPLYRHPADEQPRTVEFSTTVARCRDQVADLVGQPELNHVLIQKYRTGRDNIGEHSDKTLDVKRGSAVINLSVGATRVMKLKPKPGSGIAAQQKITLPSNSVFVLGWETNRLFTHEIKADKRDEREKRPDERMYDGQRISLTFRSIATFITPDRVLLGQGAPRKPPKKHTPEEEEEERGRLLAAFGAENKSAAFDWDAEYGAGFDLVNFKVVGGEEEKKEEDDCDSAK